MEEVNSYKTRVLELIESNEEVAYHSFFISYADSSTWYCFYNCFWSKWGEGKDDNIQRIRKIIKQYKNKIDYKTDYRPKRFLKYVFDSFYTTGTI